MQRTPITVAGILALLTSLSAMAHQQGDLFLRGGSINVEPNEGSDDLVLGGANTGFRVGVKNDAELGLTINYMIRDHWGVELLAATPFRHDLDLRRAGALSGGLAEVKHLPPTLSLLWFPAAPRARFQPYIGAGINYTWIYDEKIKNARRGAGFSDLELSNSRGLAGRFGFDYRLTDRVYLNAAAWWIDIDTTATLKVGAAPARVNVELDPWVYMVGLAYRF